MRLPDTIIEEIHQIIAGSSQLVFEFELDLSEVSKFSKLTTIAEMGWGKLFILGVGPKSISRLFEYDSALITSIKTSDYNMVFCIEPGSECIEIPQYEFTEVKFNKPFGIFNGSRDYENIFLILVK